jgi:serine/threonine protein phosphatase PrpC
MIEPIFTENSSLTKASEPAQGTSAPALLTTSLPPPSIIIYDVLAPTQLPAAKPPIANVSIAKADVVQAEIEYHLFHPAPETLIHCELLPEWLVITAQRIGINHHRDAGRCEDSVAIQALADGGLRLAVADGVSSGARGDICSSAVVKHALDLEQIASQSPNPQVNSILASEAHTSAHISTMLDSAEHAMYTALRPITAHIGATMLVGAWLNAAGTGYLAHVGDCRAYLLSTEHSPKALTKDQTYEQLGETPADGLRLTDPARMIGCQSTGDGDVQALTLSHGDALLLCTDGLYGYMDALTLQSELEIAHRTLLSSLQQFANYSNSTNQTDLFAGVNLVAQQLVKATLDAGGDDDIGFSIAIKR